jgi:1-acyl-sn-glycerol-3-phosphate acyltransferase
VAIYNHLKVDVIPTALNSGDFWDKKNIKRSGTIILEFLPAIKSGLNKKEFMNQLESSIEFKSQQISLTK